MEIHDTIAIFEIVTTALAAIAASSGFWLFINKRKSDKDVSRRVLIGLAHDRITYLSMQYINRGWISQDEYENLADYLYAPYVELGGNGAAKRLMTEVNKLPIIARHFVKSKGEKDVSK